MFYVVDREMVLQDFFPDEVTARFRAGRDLLVMRADEYEAALARYSLIQMEAVNRVVRAAPMDGRKVA